jgi:hypothetical protein
MCGNTRVRRLPARDRIDAMSAHPLSMLLGLFGAPIYHCNACRHQYHDWRPLLAATSPARAAADGAEGLDFRAPSEVEGIGRNDSEDEFIAEAPVLHQRSKP